MPARGLQVRLYLGKITDMKKATLVLIFLVSMVLAGCSMTNTVNTAGNFTLTSETIKEGEFLSDEQIYNGYGCTGGNVSPDLEWSNPPEGTKSYALIMHNPDAPMPGGWWHWIVTNIPAAKTSLAKGEIAASPVEMTKTSFGTAGYGGPCPPVGHGKHRYIFTIYALDVESVPSKPDMAPTQIEKLIEPHTLGKASVMGYFERK